MHSSKDLDEVVHTQFSTKEDHIAIEEDDEFLNEEQLASPQDESQPPSEMKDNGGLVQMVTVIAIVETISYFLIMIANGMSSSIVGVTLDKLSQNVNRSAADLGVIFTARSLGGVTGNVIGGRIFDVLKTKSIIYVNVFIVITGVLFAIVFALIPLSSNIYVLVAVFAASGFFQAFTNMGANLGLIWVWKDRVTKFMLLAHSLWGLGGVISPITLRFLSNYFHSYYLIGVISFVCALSVAVGPVIRYSIYGRGSIEGERIANNKTQSEVLTSQKHHYSSDKSFSYNLNVFLIKSKNIRIAVLVGLIVANLVGVETLINNFFYTFINELKSFDEKENKLIVTVYYIMFTLARLLSVIVSGFVKPIYMILVDIAGCLLGLSGILVLSKTRGVMYTFSAVMGLSVASLFPTTYSFPTSSMPNVVNSGVMTAIILVMSSSSSMLCPIILTKIVGISRMFWMMIVMVVMETALFLVLFTWTAAMWKAVQNTTQEPEFIETEEVETVLEEKEIELLDQEEESTRDEL